MDQLEGCLLGMHCPGSILNAAQTILVAYGCNASVWEMQTGTSEVQSRHPLHSDSGDQPATLDTLSQKQINNS